MADLEKHAIKRDTRFLVRLVLLLAAGTVAGLLLFMKLTSTSTTSCAANAIGPPSDPPSTTGASH